MPKATRFEEGYWQGVGFRIPGERRFGGKKFLVVRSHLNKYDPAYYSKAKAGQVARAIRKEDSALVRTVQIGPGVWAMYFRYTTWR